MVEVSLKMIIRMFKSIKEYGFSGTILGICNKYVYEKKIKGIVALKIMLRNDGITKEKKYKKKVIKKYKALFNKFKRVEIVKIPYSIRIGEFLSRYLLACRDIDEHKYDDNSLILFYTDYNIGTNKYLLKIMSRYINMITSENYDLWMHVLKRKRIDVFGKKDMYLLRDDNGEPFSKEHSKKWFQVTKKEEEMFLRTKSRYGIVGEYVCISSRDPSYLDSVAPNDQWDYHDYRDSDIENISMANDYLNSLGIQTVRMGRVVKKRVPFPDCVDFASDYYNEFMDIMLHGNCLFDLVDSCGINMIPLTQGRPIALKNAIPAFACNYCSVPIGCEDIMIFKKLFDSKSKRYLTILEMMAFECKHLEKAFDGKTYVENGIEVIENSPEEIKNLVEEMYLRLNGKWTDDDEILQFYDKYDDILRNHAKQCGVKMTYMWRGRISSSFLKYNRFLMEGIIDNYSASERDDI